MSHNKLLHIEYRVIHKQTRFVFIELTLKTSKTKYLAR